MQPNFIEMKTYEDTENSVSMAAEPQIEYSPVQTIPIPTPNPYNDLPEGYVTLRRFGELFHQKLDACYADLQSNR